MSKIALLPGGFKPPHAGHYNMAKWLHANTGADTTIIFVGPGVRGGTKTQSEITQKMSFKLWEIYTQNDSELEVRISKISPVGDVYDFVEKEAPEGTEEEESEVFLGIGAKDKTDKRYANIGKFAEPRNIKYKPVVVPPQAGGVSGTEMRGFIKMNDKALFQYSLPEHLSDEQKNEAWNIVTGLDEDLYNPEDKVLDYMKSSEYKAGYSKPDDMDSNAKYSRGGTYTQGGMYEDAQFETGKVLHVYDFDDTIAQVNANIKTTITSPSGDYNKVILIPAANFPEESKELETRLGSLEIEYDFSEFEKQIDDAIVNSKVVNKLKNSLSRPDIKTTILTARSIGHPVTRYMREELGLAAYVVPLGLQVDGKVTGQAKANWIEKHINKGYQTIYFIDDSEENRVAVAGLKDKYPDIRLKVEDPAAVSEMMMGMMTKQEKAKHAKNMKRLSKDMSNMKGNNYGGGGYKVPDYVKGTLTRKLYEADPKKGTGKKPKGSSRRLYTDENPKDTVKVKFSTRQDIVDTLNKASFKSKSHKRQSQVINLIHQRVRAALGRSKDPAVKKRLRSAFEYIKKRKEASKKKTQRMKNENTFSKGWWSNIINEILLTEGGAAGHMAHPFDLPNVKSGRDLKNIFMVAATSLNTNPGSVKIDGVNASIRLITLDGVKQFVMDRGSKKELDIKGITKDDLLSRFGDGHGMVKIGGEVLDMFNTALPQIENDLKALGAWEDPNILFNMEYVSGKTNVQDYGSNFIAIHGLNKIESKEVQGKRKMLTKRTSTEVSYNKSALQSMLDNLSPTAKKQGFKVYGSVPTEMKKKPNFNSALSQNYSVESTEEVKTQPLSKWLDEVSAIPKDEFIFITRDNTSKKVGAVSKQVYQLILNGENIDDLFNENDKKKAIDGFVTYLATEKLGDEILKVLDSPMGSVEDHEGVVIRDEKIASVPFKITGKFILGGLISDF